jgi:hypothetical protein
MLPPSRTLPFYRSAQPRGPPYPEVTESICRVPLKPFPHSPEYPLPIYLWRIAVRSFLHLATHLSLCVNGVTGLTRSPCSCSDAETPPVRIVAPDKPNDFPARRGPHPYFPSPPDQSPAYWFIFQLLQRTSHILRGFAKGTGHGVVTFCSAE